LKNVNPVTFPPGRAMLETSPEVTASPLVAMTIGDRHGRLLGRQYSRRSVGHDDVDFETNQFRGELREPLIAALCPSVLDDNVPSLHVAEIAQSGAKCLDSGDLTGGGRQPQKPNPRHFSRLLTARRERPRGSSAAE
jgi:hypothetical protein